MGTGIYLVSGCYVFHFEKLSWNLVKGYKILNAGKLVIEVTALGPPLSAAVPLL